jgi:hypothetical protein
MRRNRLHVVRAEIEKEYLAVLGSDRNISEFPCDLLISGFFTHKICKCGEVKPKRRLVAIDFFRVQVKPKLIRMRPAVWTAE